LFPLRAIIVPFRAPLSGGPSQRRNRKAKQYQIINRFKDFEIRLNRLNDTSSPKLRRIRIVQYIV